MKIEVGKSYVTKNGCIVHIKYNSNEMGFKYNVRPYGGIIEGRGSDFFTETGIYSLDNPNSGFDIEKEL
ncbi:hypothetical protein [Pedobacter africanus]|uniref:Uncharacterized protein n=1 Tax=Pedobacter africanus TaxID=151894 RepID=A0A1W1ZCE0_9SPHI|nr:hypothetical protein [Pedobacter africanus]SMC46094.1 hypothetical protein SAMN04488524_0596 [Pedobacter africanus]